MQLVSIAEFCGENPFPFLCSLSDPFIICYSLYLCYTCLQWIFWPLLIYSVAHILTDTQTSVLFLDIRMHIIHKQSVIINACNGCEHTTFYCGITELYTNILCNILGVFICQVHDQLYYTEKNVLVHIFNDFIMSVCTSTLYITHFVSI